MKSLFENFLKIALGISILWYVLHDNVQFKQFTDGASKVFSSAKNAEKSLKP